MHYSPQNEECPMALNPFKACVAPRPIGWISTVSRDGIDNLAPFSQFQNLSYDPPMVMIAINQGGDEPDHVHRKDTVNNIESTGCFVYNAVPYDLKEQMNITASGFAPEEDEFEKAGLHKAESVRVAAKRVAESPIQFECEYMQTIRIPGTMAGGKGTVDLIIGKVVEIHVADEIILPNGKLDYRKLRLIGRAGYWDYGVMEDTFAMKVPGVSAARMAAMEGRKPNEADLEKDKKGKQPMISFIGMILGLLLFVVLAFKGFNLILSAVASSCLMFVFSGISILDGLKEFYLPGLAGFLQSYFLLFFLSALMGKLMSDGEMQKDRLVLIRADQKSKNNQKFFCVLLVPVLYFILCYVGISGFVVVFTVLPIAKTIYEETDTPWRLYCCAGAQTVSAAYLAGSIQAGNVYATDICGTTTMAGWKLSIVAVVTFWAVSLVFLWTMLKITQKKGEAFLPSGEGIRMANLDEGLSEDCLPGLLPSILPLAVVLVLSAGFQVYVVKALFAGCILTVITGHKNLLPKLKTSLSQGITAAYGPILSVSATYAIGAVVKNIEGFTYFQNMLSALPHLMSGSLMGLLAAFIMASVAAPIPAFGSHMLDQYTLAGLSAGNAHRMMMLTSFTSIAPHNAGIPNAAAVLRMPYAECLKMYMMSTYIPGFITLFVSILCIKMGIV